MENNVTAKPRISLPSAFYTRQYTTRLSTRDDILVFRWFQFLEYHRHLFSVKNNHDCFGETTPGTIIQPFASFDDFFGCIICGKYHVCQLHRDTCEIMIDPHNDHQICRYSKRPLLEQDNLVLTFEDGSHFDHEACYYNTAPIKPRSRIELHTQRKRKKSTDRRDLIDLFKQPSSNDDAARSKKRARIDPTPWLTSLDYELSIDSLEEDAVTTTTHGEEREDDCDVIHEDDIDLEQVRAILYASDNEESIDELHKVTSDDEEEDVKKTRHEDVDTSVPTLHDHIDGHADNDEGEDGETFLLDGMNSDGGHVKNYHNNIKYRNEYYDFLRGILEKQRRLQATTSATSTGDEDDARRFVELYSRNMREETIEETTTTTPTNNTENNDVIAHKIQPLSAYIREQIERETHETLSLLLRLYATHAPPEKYSLTALVMRYVPLIENIVQLVYHSPVINCEVLTRDIKNHNQSHYYRPKAAPSDTPQHIPTIDETRLEHVLTPQRMCRALLLHTLLESFSLYDELGHRIGIWQADPWLRRFNLKKHKRVLIRDFYALYQRGLIVTATTTTDLDLFKREILDASGLIRESLEYYRLCPQWLRYRIFKLRAK